MPQRGYLEYISIHSYNKKCVFLVIFTLNFRAHDLQSELNKIGYTNFVKFGLQSISSEIERVFEAFVKKTQNTLEHLK